MKIKLKNGLYLLNFSILVSLMASCLGNNPPNDIFPTTDAELLSFSLTSDSCPLLDSVVFTIDQRAGLIYNYDSMAYQTVVKDKPVVTYLSATSTDNLLNITGGDSIWVKNSDSLDISKPLTFRVYALDGKTTKIYTMQLNIHQVDPDSVQYFRIDSGLPFLQTEETKTVVFNGQFLTYSKINNQIQLYSSPDAVNWTQQSLSGLPANAVIQGIQNDSNRLYTYTDDGNLYYRDSLALDDQWTLVNKPPSIKIKSVLGYLSPSPNNSEGLSMIIETGGINTFAFTDKNFNQWNYDSITPVPIPDDFPVSGFSTYNYQQMYLSRISVFGGASADGVVQNAVWSTGNGLYWAKLTGVYNVFPQLEGANIFYYHNEFWLINGQTAGGDYNRDIYYSIDGGVTWQIRPQKCAFPDDYTGRYGASLVLSKDNKQFYIIGGKQVTLLPEVWRGFLNKMEFDH